MVTPGNWVRRTRVSQSGLTSSSVSGRDARVVCRGMAPRSGRGFERVQVELACDRPAEGVGRLDWVVVLADAGDLAVVEIGAHDIAVLVNPAVGHREIVAALEERGVSVGGEADLAVERAVHRPLGLEGDLPESDALVDARV